MPTLVAAGRSGATLSRTLSALDAASVKRLLLPAVSRDAMLVTDASRFCRRVGAAPGVPREKINRSSGERVRGALHVQTVNSRHSRIKDFLRGFRGIAARNLDSCLRWFRLVELGDQPSPRARLDAAMGTASLRFAN